MKINQLKCFIAVEKYHSFSQAADSLFVTQSALSKQILSLEKELGVQLFERRGHSVELTPAGDKIYAHVNWMLGEYTKMLEGLSLLNSLAANKISLSAPFDMSHFGIADMVIDFELSHPGVIAETHESNHEYMVYNLENRLTDFAIGFSEFWPRNESLITYPLMQDPLVLVMHHSHRLANASTLSLIDAVGEMFCLPREDTHFFRMFQGLCADLDFSPNITLSDVRLSTIKRYISHGMRLTMVPLQCALNYFTEPEFVVVPVKNVKPLTLALMTRNEKLSSINQEFIRHASTYFETNFLSLNLPSK